MLWRVNNLEYVFYFVYKPMYFTWKTSNDASQPISGVRFEHTSSNSYKAYVLNIFPNIPKMTYFFKEPVLYAGEINEDIIQSSPPTSGEEYIKRVM